MKKILLPLLTALLLNGCAATGPLPEPLPAIPLQSMADLQDYEIQQVEFPNESGLMGYYISQLFLADTNGDGLYELYTNSHAGSGIIHDFVQCYDPATGEFYAVEDRMQEDFSCVIVQDELYILGRTVYRPVLDGNGLTCQPLPEGEAAQILQSAER